MQSVRLGAYGQCGAAHIELRRCEADIQRRQLAALHAVRRFCAYQGCPYSAIFPALTTSSAAVLASGI